MAGTDLGPTALWLVIFAAGLGTYALRVSFVALFGRLDDVPPNVERALRFVPAAVHARAGVRAEVDVDVRNVEFVGRIDLLLHAVDGLRAEVVLRRAEVHEVRRVDDPRAEGLGDRAVAEGRRLLVADVRVLPDLRGVGEYLPAVAADVELVLDGVIDAASDGNVGSDLHVFGEVSGD